MRAILADSMSTPAATVTPLSALAFADVAALLAHYGLRLQRVADGAPIPGSYWGESEAGLIGNTLYARADTPVHSVLHEACHWICMDEARRAALHTDAGGSDVEECGVCYLEILLADRLPGYSRAQACADMDAWGYHFRLGSAQAWFEHDAEDGRAFLQRRGLIAGPQDALQAPPAVPG